MPGTFSPSPQVSDPDMHHGTCVTHVPWCMPGSLTSGFIWNRRRGKRSRHSRRMRNMQFYVSGKRPMAIILLLYCPGKSFKLVDKTIIWVKRELLTWPKQKLCQKICVHMSWNVLFTFLSLCYGECCCIHGLKLHLPIHESFRMQYWLVAIRTSSQIYNLCTIAHSEYMFV